MCNCPLQIVKQRYSTLNQPMAFWYEKQHMHLSIIISFFRRVNAHQYSTIITMGSTIRWITRGNLQFLALISKNFLHLGPVIRKMFPFDDVIMTKQWPPGNISHYFHGVLRYVNNTHVMCPIFDFYRILVDQRIAHCVYHGKRSYIIRCQ